MKNFNIFVEVEDNVLYISNEDGSGAKYNIEDFADIKHYINQYIETYIEETNNG